MTSVRRLMGTMVARSSILISAVICTHNRADLLKQALESLVAQSLGEDQYEIIVVDNRSTDATPAIVAACQQAAPSCRIQRVYEPQLGLGCARNTGWRQGVGAYVAFMDDDAKADPHWLEYAVRCFGEIFPRPVAVGGPIFPYYDAPKQAWFKDEYEVRSWGDSERFLRRGESFSGSNMIFRRDALEVFGGFDVRVGMKGTMISVGEETSLFQKIAASVGSCEGLPLYYSPRMLVYHVVAARKMHVRYHLHRAFATGRDWYILNGPTEFRACVRFLRDTARAIRDRTMSAVMRFQAFPNYRNWMVECVSLVVIDLGRFLQGVKACFVSVQWMSDTRRR